MLMTFLPLKRAYLPEVKKMPLYLVYPLYTGILGLVMLAVVPRERIRELVPYALVFGAVLDFLINLVLGNYFNALSYINYGPYGFLGIPFFP